MASPSFVDVKGVSMIYTRPRNLFERFLGKPPQTDSALRDISFTLSPGDHVTLFGRPGSGKTTLLQLLTGAIAPTRGRIIINGTHKIHENLHAAAGYISSEESERHVDTVHDVLYNFGRTHAIPHLVERLTDLLTVTGLDPVASRPAAELSKTQRLRLNLARAALSEAPLILCDDVADELGVQVTSDVLHRLFTHRTVIIATRSAETADKLGLPVLLLHNHSIAQYGTPDEIADHIGYQRVVDVWVEGVRYDMLRRLKNHPGVISVQLLPSTQFSGQQLRIVVHSAYYLPSLYDMLSAAPLIKVVEIPPSLQEMVEKL